MTKTVFYTYGNYTSSFQTTWEQSVHEYKITR